MMITHMGDEAVEFFLPDKVFQMEQEVESFLVWYGRKGVIRVLAFEVWY